jgi:hypothetical protein
MFCHETKLDLCTTPGVKQLEDGYTKGEGQTCRPI